MRRAPFLKVLPAYQPRFVTEAGLAEMIELWHLAKVPVCDRPLNTRAHRRKIWAAEQFHVLHPEISSTAAYKDLDAYLEGNGR